MAGAAGGGGCSDKPDYNGDSSVQRQIDQYRYQLVRLYHQITQSKPIEAKPIDECSNHDLAKLFELWTCIEMMKLNNEIYTLWEDTCVLFKEKNGFYNYDTGVDAVSIQQLDFVQSKLRKLTLTWKELATFYAHFVGDSVEYNNLTVVHNDDAKLAKQLSKRIKNSKKMRNIPLSVKEMIDFCKSTPIESIKIESIKMKEDREYQKLVVEFIINSTKSVIIRMPTGSGKTIIMLSVIDKLLQNNPTTKFLILVPRIILLEQFETVIKDYFPHLRSKTRYIGSNRCKEYIPSDSKNVVICVYNSYSKIKKHSDSFNGVFVDEAHHIFRSQMIDIEQDYEDDDEDEETDKDITYTDEIRTLCKNKITYAFSATIDEVEGFDLYDIGLRQLINEGYLCDYQFKMEVFEQVNRETFSDYVIRSHTNSIIYCKDQTEGKELTTLMNTKSAKCAGYIDSNTTKSERELLITKYRQGDLSFLVNVNVLTEGFDAPITKSTIMYHIPSSSIKLKQILGRMLRKHPTKTMGNMVLVVDQHNIDRAWSAIDTIVENDHQYNKLMKKAMKNKHAPTFVNISMHAEEDSELYFKLNEYVIDSLGNIVSGNEYALVMIQKVDEFITINNKRPNKRSEDSEEKALAHFIIVTLNDEKNDRKWRLSDETVYQKWKQLKIKHKEIFFSPEEIWNNKYDVSCNFMNINKRRPNRESTDETERMCAHFIQVNEQNHIHKRNIQQKPFYHKKWGEFKVKYQEYLQTDEDKALKNIEEIEAFWKKHPRKFNSTNEKNLQKRMRRLDDKWKRRSECMEHKAVYEKWSQIRAKYGHLIMNEIEKKIDDLKKVKHIIHKYGTLSEKLHKRSSIECKIINFARVEYRRYRDDYYLETEYRREHYKMYYKELCKFISTYYVYIRNRGDQKIDSVRNIEIYLKVNKIKPKSNSENKWEKDIYTQIIRIRDNKPVRTDNEKNIVEKYPEAFFSLKKRTGDS